MVKEARRNSATCSRGTKRRARPPAAGRKVTTERTWDIYSGDGESGSGRGWAENDGRGVGCSGDGESGSGRGWAENDGRGVGCNGDGESGSGRGWAEKDGRGFIYRERRK